MEDRFVPRRRRTEWLFGETTGRSPWRVLRVNWPVVARPELHMTFERLKNWLVSWETIDPWPSFRLALAEHEWVIYE